MSKNYLVEGRMDNGLNVMRSYEDFESAINDALGVNPEYAQKITKCRGEIVTYIVLGGIVYEAKKIREVEMVFSFDVRR